MGPYVARLWQPGTGKTVLIFPYITSNGDAQRHVEVNKRTSNGGFSKGFRYYERLPSDKLLASWQNVSILRKKHVTTLAFV